MAQINDYINLTSITSNFISQNKAAYDMDDVVHDSTAVGMVHIEGTFLFASFYYALPVVCAFQVKHHWPNHSQSWKEKTNDCVNSGRVVLELKIKGIQYEIAHF